MEVYLLTSLGPPNPRAPTGHVTTPLWGIVELGPEPLGLRVALVASSPDKAQARVAEALREHLQPGDHRRFGSLGQTIKLPSATVETYLKPMGACCWFWSLAIRRMIEWGLKYEPFFLT